MTHFRIAHAAELLGVSDDTLRRWIDAGHLEATTDDAGRKVVPGEALARRAQQLAARGPAAPSTGARSSARNRFTGLVTGITTDKVMAQVDLQCGPYRVVSLMSAEAVADLGLRVGSLATAVIKSTNVVVEAEAP